MGRKKALAIIYVGVCILFVCLGISLLNKKQEDCWLYQPSLFDSRVGENIDNPFRATSASTAYCKTGSLASGVYDVKISYQTTAQSFSVSCSSENTDGNQYPVIYADTYSIDSAREEMDFTIWINGDVDELRVNFSWNDAGSYSDPLYIDHIVLERDYRKSVLYGAVKLLAAFCLFSCVMLLIWKWDIAQKKLRENYLVILGLGCVFLVCSMGIFSYSVPHGNDIPFHLARIAGLAEGIKSGSFPVRMQPGWNNGYGYPVSIYYGDIFLYVPAILYLLQVPLMYAYKVYVLMVNLGRVLISFYCFSKLSHDKLTGITCSALYSLSVNCILNIYLRAAVGEYTATVFLPLIILGLVNLLSSEEDGQHTSGWVALAVGMTGVIQSHVLSTEMVCIFIAITIIIMLPAVFRKKRVIALCKSVLLACGLNAGFLVPFLDYAREDILVYADKGRYGMQGLGLSLYELLSLPTKGIGGAGDATEGLYSRMPEALGIPFLIIVIAVVSVSVVCNNCKQKERKKLVTTLILAAVACFMATVYFPWNVLGEVPVVQNMVNSIQFPWRFLTIAVAILTYTACILMGVLKNCLENRTYKGLLIGMCLICAVQGMYTTDLIVRNINVLNIYDADALLEKENVVNGGEYLLEGSSVELAFRQGDITGTGGVEISNVERNGTTIALFCRTVQEAELSIPLFAYDYYRCMDMETGDIYPCLRGGNNRISIALPAGYEGTLKIFFDEPWYWKVSTMVSVITLVVCVLVYYRRRRLIKKQ